jgi:hypothetical protein
MRITGQLAVLSPAFRCPGSPARGHFSIGGLATDRQVGCFRVADHLGAILKLKIPVPGKTRVRRLLLAGGLNAL